MYYASRWCNGQDARDIDNVKLVWDQCLKNVTDEEMTGGLELLKFNTKEYIVFPPTPNQFRELCYQFRSRQEMDVPLLSHTQDLPSPAQRRAYMNDMWKALGRLDKIR